jgi:hypothetical protein
MGYRSLFLWSITMNKKNMRKDFEEMIAYKNAVIEQVQGRLKVTQDELQNEIKRANEWKIEYDKEIYKSQQYTRSIENVYNAISSFLEVKDANYVTVRQF